MTRPAAGGRATSIPLLGREEEPTVFELSAPGRRAWSFRTTGVPEWSAEELVPAEHLAGDPLPLAEVSERDLVAHYTRLSARQYSVDLGAYPLGSCTMSTTPSCVTTPRRCPGLTDVTPAAPRRSPPVGSSCWCPGRVPVRGHGHGRHHAQPPPSPRAS